MPTRGWPKGRSARVLIRKQDPLPDCGETVNLLAMARSGMDHLRNENLETRECGCELVNYGPPVNGWVYLHKCDEHKEASGE